MVFDSLHEECGLFGVCNRNGMDAVSASYYALFALQHRGQESCGIAVNDRGVIRCHKDAGLVNEVFTKDVMSSLGSGNMAMGHVRYGKDQNGNRLNAQPLVVNHIKGAMALAHNGALTNAATLREELELRGSIFQTDSDIEVIAYVITQERLTAASIEEAVERAMARLEGAYSLIIMSPKKIIAARDPHGFRPLCIGACGPSYIFASETCALDSIGAAFVRDVKPGEIVVAEREGGLRSIETHVGTKPKSTCVFEYIYFARPDSVIDGSSVTIARQRAGAFLALEHPVQADIIVGVPDSGIDAAIGYAHQSGIPYGLGFIKNKYIGRTFIQPTQAGREDQVRIKLNPIASQVNGKRVVLIDDSIVRGTTCARIIGLLRAAGAREVHVRSAAPPFMYPCYFGTNIDSREHLIAANHTISEIRDKLGADSLGFLSWENVSKLCDNTTGFCTGCFTGQYPSDPPKRANKSKYTEKLPEGSR